MQHSYFDKYADRQSPVHSISIRVKLFIFLGLLSYFALMPVNWFTMAINIGALVILFGVARIPAIFVVKRTLVILPFLVFIILLIPLFQEQSWQTAVDTFSRALSSVLTLVLFVSTTRFPRLLRELERLHVPVVIVQILAFIYRYFFVLIDELERMRLAVRARAPHKKRRMFYKGFSHLLGMLIIRSYERSERIYQAMQLRGYQQEQSQ